LSGIWALVFFFNRRLVWRSGRFPFFIPTFYSVIGSLLGPLTRLQVGQNKVCAFSPFPYGPAYSEEFSSPFNCLPVARIFSFARSARKGLICFLLPKFFPGFCKLPGVPPHRHHHITKIWSMITFKTAFPATWTSLDPFHFGLARLSVMTVTPRRRSAYFGIILFRIVLPVPLQGAYSSFILRL